MKLKGKIISLVIAILVISIGSITILSFIEMKKLLRDQIDKNMLNIADSFASTYEVKEYLKGNKAIPIDLLNSEIEKARIKTNVEFIVIMDMNGIRYSHPDKSKIGERFAGGDEDRVLNTGEQYISTGSGTLGVSVRAFAPIYDDSNKQIGAVAVGMLYNKFDNEVYTKMYKFIPIILMGLILGISGAIVLSYNIKKSIFGLEPEEIALALKQKETVIENIKEGIIALDNNGCITLFNGQASKILYLKENDIGKPITDFTYESMALKVLNSGKSMTNIEIKVRPGVNVMCKYSIIRGFKKQILGLVVTFEDLSEVRKMAEELTGIKKMAWSLRAQNHEFMNKLHTISGLIQLEEYDEVIKFVNVIVESKKNITTIISDKIKNVSLAALILSKYSKCEEARINLIIDDNSRVIKLPQYMTSEELGSVVGNLIENSIDAVKNDGSGEIYMKIFEEDDQMKIMVKDNGCGIPENIRNSIYNIGITSKEGERGFGMYIVKKIIDEAKGAIKFKVDDGTEWDISIPMRRS
ncbi:ATP-binding protein [Clostridium beijerinckii]|uniref:Two-component system CitB family sensor kinase n=1 Tax=Clostridium beijerinckii TaxID=1520 RepID=A0AAX0B9C0_CLOBE|nr:sensor histidine kinase [Clostridium beijerinckii]MBA8933334.1 two-component system CitB family sensor kinase [Clostridium beijerinckii]NRT36719.1 two-component system CitB family sensor kinase [Clostridium beijerinckii]NRT43848.1 two-component system CitB family sensor kinase [Clostridium beijerinckii]NRT91756.1 two-component system CitB family sensor kinase [Clostridium beijerinckii]NRU37535.1 two-component system CitB family sensor kinase [Clostridium beijerinckii]